jgi:hypothetical protein
MVERKQNEERKMLIDKLDDYLDNDKYALTNIILEYVDADSLETVLRGMYKAKLLDDDESLALFARSLTNEMHAAILELLTK